MKLCVISGSTRADSQSAKIARYLTRRIQSRGNEVSILDLSTELLPLYTDDDVNAQLPVVANVLRQLEETDGYVFVSPEWNGMASIGILNMLHYAGQQLAHKPVLLVGISASRGGSYPVLQLRQMGYKNRHFVLVPEQLVITRCEAVMNDDSFAEDASDIYIKKRADYALGVLTTYAEALAQVRKSPQVRLDTYPNGM
jgi:multimeric flavodoxin WrbA